MPTYKVLNDADEVINTIVADAEFMAANFSKYEEVVAPARTDEEIEDGIISRRQNQNSPNRNSSGKI